MAEVVLARIRVGAALTACIRFGTGTRYPRVECRIEKGHGTVGICPGIQRSHIVFLSGMDVLDASH